MESQQKKKENNGTSEGGWGTKSFQVFKMLEHLAHCGEIRPREIRNYGTQGRGTQEQRKTQKTKPEKKIPHAEERRNAKRGGEKGKGQGPPIQIKQPESNNHPHIAEHAQPKEDGEKRGARYTR